MIPSRRTMTRFALNPPVQAIYNLIGPLAFARMKASNVVPDNGRRALQWKLKNSRYTSIRVACRQDKDDYQVGFLISTPHQFTEIVIEPVKPEALLYTIERMTGIRLSEVVADFLE